MRKVVFVLIILLILTVIYASVLSFEDLSTSTTTGTTSPIGYYQYNKLEWCSANISSSTGSYLSCFYDGSQEFFPIVKNIFDSTTIVECKNTYVHGYDINACLDKNYVFFLHIPSDINIFYDPYVSINIRGGDYEKYYYLESCEAFVDSSGEENVECYYDDGKNFIPEILSIIDSSTIIEECKSVIINNNDVNACITVDESFFLKVLEGLDLFIDSTAVRTDINSTRLYGNTDPIYRYTYTKKCQIEDDGSLRKIYCELDDGYSFEIKIDYTSQIKYCKEVLVEQNVADLCISDLENLFIRPKSGVDLFSTKTTDENNNSNDSNINIVDNNNQSNFPNLDNNNNLIQNYYDYNYETSVRECFTEIINNFKITKCVSSSGEVRIISKVEIEDISGCNYVEKDGEKIEVCETSNGDIVETKVIENTSSLTKCRAIYDIYENKKIVCEDTMGIFILQKKVEIKIIL